MKIEQKVCRYYGSHEMNEDIAKKNEEGWTASSPTFFRSHHSDDIYHVLFTREVEMTTYRGT